MRVVAIHHTKCKVVVFLHCLTQNEMEPFNGEMLKRQKMVKETQLLEIICTCRCIEDGNMGECDVCKEWFHQGCITVPENVWNTMDV